MRKRIVSILLVVTMLLAFAIGVTAQSDEENAPTISIDGEEIAFQHTPVVKSNGKLWVPLIEICNALGAKMTKWEESDASVLAVFPDFAIDAKAGKNYINANGRCLGFDGECISLDDDLLVPTEVIAKAFMANYSFDEELNTATLYTGSEVIESGDEFYNQEDLYWLARIIWAESGNQPFVGKLAVGNVVMNRMHLPNFPDTVYGVVFDTRCGVQFSPILNGTIYNTPTEDCWIAAKMAMEGERPVGDCLYFAAIKDCWAAYNRPYYTTIGGHDFYL